MAGRTVMAARLALENCCPARQHERQAHPPLLWDWAAWRA